MSNVEFTSHLKEHEAEFDKKLHNALEKCATDAESFAVNNLTQNKSVITGLLRNSITHAIGGEPAAIGSYHAERGIGSKPPASGTYSGSAQKTNDPTVFIGTNVEYAPMVELGTSRSAAKPYLKPAVADHADHFKKIFQSVFKD